MVKRKNHQFNQIEEEAAARKSRENRISLAEKAAKQLEQEKCFANFERSGHRAEEEMQRNDGKEHEAERRNYLTHYLRGAFDTEAVELFIVT